MRGGRGGAGEVDDPRGLEASLHTDSLNKNELHISSYELSKHRLHNLKVALYNSIELHKVYEM